MALMFVSYSRKDSEFVLRLAADLRQRGVPLWLDQWAIPPGSHWDVVIENALEDATHVLLVLSKTSVKSANVRDEIDMAITEGKTIIPIRLETCRPPLRVRRINYMDFTGDYQAALGELLNALSQYGLPAPRPPMTEKQATYFAFWHTLLATARQHTQRHAGISPAKQNRIAASAGHPGLKFEYALHRHAASVGLLIGRSNRKDNEMLFDALKAQKQAVESTFDAPLEWDRLDRHKICRILARIDHDETLNETTWPSLQASMIEAMVRLEAALLPLLENLASK